MEWLEKDKLFTIAANKKSRDFRSNNFSYLLSTTPVIENLWTRIPA
jgi:hypothetical protein